MDFAFFTIVLLLFCVVIVMMSVRSRENLLLAMWVALGIPAAVAVVQLLLGP